MKKLKYGYYIFNGRKNWALELLTPGKVYFIKRLSEKDKDDIEKLGYTSHRSAEVIGFFDGDVCIDWHTEDVAMQTCSPTHKEFDDALDELLKD